MFLHEASLSLRIQNLINLGVVSGIQYRKPHVSLFSQNMFMLMWMGGALEFFVGEDGNHNFR